MKIDKFKDFLFEHKLHKNQYQLLDYIEKLSKDKVFVFIDTETTGLGGFKKQQLTQISAIIYDYDFITNTLKENGTYNQKIKISSDMKDRLYNPDDNIKKIFKFNRYGDKISDKPKYFDEQETLKDFKNWLSHCGYYKDPVLIMQNANFDMNMLVGRGGDKIKCNDGKPCEVLDTKQIIQLFIIPIVEKLSETDNKYNKILDEIGTSDRDFGLTSSSMSKWGPFFDINMSGYHDALTDCRITSQMFTKIIEFIKEHSDLNISKYQVKRMTINK